MHGGNGIEAYNMFLNMPHQRFPNKHFDEESQWKRLYEFDKMGYIMDSGNGPNKKYGIVGAHAYTPIGAKIYTDPAGK
jgi:hypothetical protein